MRTPPALAELIKNSFCLIIYFPYYCEPSGNIPDGFFIFLYRKAKTLILPLK
jgi:hypothetical protein